MASTMEGLKNRVNKLLRSIEPYTKTDMVYLAKGGFWLGIGQFVSSLSALLTSIAFANLLSPDAYGVYRYIISVNALLLITTLSGMDSAVTQSVARGFEGTLKIGAKEKMKWGILGTIASFSIALYYFFQGNMILTIGFSITAIFVPFIESFDMYNSLLWGKRLFDIQTKYNVIKKIIALISIVGIVFFTKNIYLIILTYFVSIVIPNIYFYYKTENKYISNNEIDPKSISYGKKLSWVYIFNTLLSELDKILVFQYIGASNLATYSLAVAPTDQIKGLLKNLNSLAMPQFSQRTISDIKKNINHKIYTLSIFTTLIVIIYIFISPLFFETFFPKYLESIKYSQLLSISLIPVVVSSFLYTILEAQKAENEIYKYNLISNVFGIIILIPFVYYLGIWGAIISRTFTRTFGLIFSLFLIKKIN